MHYRPAFPSHAKPAKPYDRDALIGDVRREIERIRRYGVEFSLLFIDLDNLKTLNETYGWAAGDDALNRLNDALRNNTRLIDQIYRFEGDKFVILLPGADNDAARRVAQKLITRIRAIRIPAEAREFNITVSMGVTAFDEHTVQDVDGVLTTVEMLLATAKKSGKNLIRILEDGGVQRNIVEQPPAPAGAVPGLPGEHQRMVIRGISIVPGIAAGRVFIHKDILAEKLEQYAVEEQNIEDEFVRIKNAMKHVKNDIARMEHQVRINLGREYADIFAVHKAILNDINLINELETQLRNERINAEHIVKSVFKRFENRLISSESEIMRERYLDIADLSRRLLRYLTGVNRNVFARLPKNRIIAAKRLLPSESVHLRKGSVLAIITEKGSKNSHAAILARGLGIPYVSETELPIDGIGQDEQVIVNGNTGEIIVNPLPGEREDVGRAFAAQRSRSRALQSRLRNVVLEKDGRRITVMANANSDNGIRDAMEYGGDGIGLFRIEQIYMQSRVFPTEEQLARTLDDMLGSAGNREITVRLLDIGGDKTLPYFDMRSEIYSFMGLRGVRVLLRYPRILETQLLALLKLSGSYRIRIMIPLVTLPDEIAAVREVLERCMKTLRAKNISFNPAIPLGSMIEVPAAVISIDDILAGSDFVSIGTNDLIQYVMASGRENAALARYYEAGGSIVLSQIGRVCERAAARGKECSLCGELAADTAYTGRLLDIGLRHFSVAPANIPRIKARIADLLAAPVPA